MHKVILGIAAATLVCGQLVVAAHADTTDATCEVRKDGDKQKGKSGPCTYSQRQAYIDIDLKNGDTLNLSPAGGANQYHDQHHNKVHRTNSGSRTQEFKWEGGRRVIVTFRDDYYGGNGNNYNHNNGGGSYAAGKERDDYQRGYRDGLAGRYDQNDHTQAYKDGVRAGENESGRSGGYNNGNGYGNGSHGNYTVESIGNGMFEVKWPNGCIADYTRDGRNDGYTNCNDEMKRRSDEVARQRSR